MKRLIYQYYENRFDYLLDNLYNCHYAVNNTYILNKTIVNNIIIIIYW